MTAPSLTRVSSRAARAVLLAALSGWAVQVPVTAQVPGAHEWPDTDFTRTLVDLDEIRSGGPPKDGIPSIDAPAFVTPEADRKSVV